MKVDIMTSYVVTGFQTTLPYVSLNSFDSLLIGTGSGLYVPGEYIGSFLNRPVGVELTVLGDLAADIVFLGGQSYIFIGAQGTLVCGGDSGIYLDDTGYSIVENHGAISNFDGNAIVMHNDDYVFNSGLILGDYGVKMATGDGYYGRLVNSGTITGSATGVYLGTQYSSVDNSGTIQSQNFGLYVEGDSSDPLSGLDTAQFVNNSGTITGNQREAVFILLHSTLSEFHLHNSGVISSNNYITIASGGSSRDFIRNTGTINGEVYLHIGDDVFNGRGGTVNGLVDTGYGSDLLDLRGAVVTGSVRGDFGADTYYIDDSTIQLVEGQFSDDGAIDSVFANTSYRLGTFFESLTLLGSGNFRGVGNSGINTLAGNIGDNLLLGLGGKDKISGDLGDDRLQGGSDLDQLDGGGGDDELVGGAGNDKILGSDGADTLIGGAGLDTMTGGLDADVFVFAVLGHTGNLTSTADVIVDFTRGEDLIRISAIDANALNAASNDAFTFIGPTGFTGVAGQMKVFYDATNTYVAMDTDGNSVADAIIRLNGLYSLTASDFVL
jgi:serralysin